jgi:hypothetical protein
MDGVGLNLECRGAGSNQVYACALQGEKKTVQSIIAEDVQTILTGHPINQAKALLRSHYPELDSAVIEIYPKGWPWFPFLASRIHVEVR